MASAGMPLLLRCLDKLNDDVWSGLLLPMLVRDKSAPAVAASCSALRKLCHSAAFQLTFTPTSTSGDFSTVKRHVETLHQHFPACLVSGVALVKDNCYLLAPAIMEGLSGLKHLSTLEIIIDRSDGSSVALAMVLSSLNTHLPQLRTLLLNSKHSWSGAQEVWQQLGQATQLTHLRFYFMNEVGVGGHMKDLAPLSSLTGLQQLRFQLVNDPAQLQPEGVEPGDAGFLAHLTALTSLHGDFVQKAGMLESISSCTALQTLSLSTESLVQPSSSDWQVLGSLSCLTRLSVSGTLLREDPQPFHSALGRLTSLQQISAGHLTWGVLPTLAALTKLTYVCGGWPTGDQGWNGDCVCEQVVAVQVNEESRSVPYRAFPNAGLVGLAAPSDAASWLALGSYCPKVKEIKLAVDRPPLGRPDWPCFLPSASGPERVAALQGLAQLTSLVQLAFSISHKLEVVAFADAMAQVPSLRLLVLVVCSSPELDWGSLLPLCKLSQITIADMSIRLPLPSKHDAQMLLSGFAHVPTVNLAVGAADVAAVQEAVQDSRALGLKLPGRVTITHYV